MAFAVAMLLFSYCLSDLAFAGFERRFLGTRALGASGALAAFGDGGWSFYFNPARTSDMNQIDVFYSPAIFGLQEIRSTGISISGNTFGMNCIAAVHTFGFELYRETVFSLNLSLPVYDFLFLGSNANLNHLFIKDYGTGLALSIDAGARAFVLENLAAGFSVTNLNSCSVTLSNDPLPQALAVGVAFVSEKLNIGLDYYREIGFPSAVRIAAEYSPFNFMTFRTGTASGANSINAGLSMRLSQFEIGYGGMFHRILGATHSFSVSLDFGNNGNSEFEHMQKYRNSLKGR